jgi:hypothetical protein
MLSDKQRQRYRRLLRAYPSSPRRQELLDTLVKNAGPDRDRPTVWETVNLLRHGMRARLGRPGSTVVVVFAVAAMIVCGFFGSVGAIWLTWAVTARPMPAGVEADALKATVFPGMTVLDDGKARCSLARLMGTASATTGCRKGGNDPPACRRPAVVESYL